MKKSLIGAGVSLFILIACSSSNDSSQELKKGNESRDLVLCEANTTKNGSTLEEKLKVTQVDKNQFQMSYVYSALNNGKIIKEKQEIEGKTPTYFEYEPVLQPNVIIIDLKNPVFKRKNENTSETKKLDAVRIQILGKKIEVFTLRDLSFKGETILSMSTCQSFVK